MEESNFTEFTDEYGINWKIQKLPEWWYNSTENYKSENYKIILFDFSNYNNKPNIKKINEEDTTKG